jgi:hypothetical protein
MATVSNKLDLQGIINTAQKGSFGGQSVPQTLPVAPAPKPTPMPSPVVVPAKTLGTTPIKVPETVKTPTTGSLSMANNATTGVIKADSTYTPPVNKDKEDAKGALQKILGNISGQAAAEAKIQKEEQLAEKKQRAVAISNELDQLDKSFQDQVNEIKENTQGKLASGIQQEIAVAQDRYENRRANISLAYKVAYGDYQGAQDIVTQKVNALKDQNTQSIQAYKLFADSINDDLTESEKLQVQAQMQRKESEAKAVQDTYQNALAAAVQNNAPSSVLSAIDEASRQPGATSATILAAAGSYAITKDLQFVSGTENQSAGYFDKNTGRFTPTGGGGGGGGGGIVTTSTGERGIKNADGSITAMSDINFDDPQQVDNLPVNDITKAVMGGYIKTKELTPTQKGVVASDLQKVGFNPNTYVAKKLDTLIQSWTNVPEGSKGVVQGLKFWERWTVPEVSNFESNKAILTREIARLNDVGVLSDQDVESYNNAMPSRQDQSLEVVLNKASGIRSSITGESSGDMVGDIITLKDGRTAIVGADGDTLLDPKTGKKLE